MIAYQQNSERRKLWKRIRFLVMLYLTICNYKPIKKVLGFIIKKKMDFYDYKIDVLRMNDDYVNKYEFHRSLKLNILRTICGLSYIVMGIMTITPHILSEEFTNSARPLLFSVLSASIILLWKIHLNYYYKYDYYDTVYLEEVLLEGKRVSFIYLVVFSIGWLFLLTRLLLL